MQQLKKFELFDLFSCIKLYEFEKNKEVTLKELGKFLDIDTHHAMFRKLKERLEQEGILVLQASKRKKNFYYFYKKRLKRIIEENNGFNFIREEYIRPYNPFP